MSAQVTIEDAYGEACQALGEAIVVQRLQGKELARLAKERDDLLHQADPAPEGAGTVYQDPGGTPV